MTGFNHFHEMKKSSDYMRELYFCSTCKTPQYANREKDLPRFCPVCHVLASWKLKEVDN